MTLSSGNLKYYQDNFVFNFLQDDLNDDEFYELCQRNQHLKLERNPDGTVITMPNTGGKTGKRNIEINTELNLYRRKNQSGNVFDSSTAFIFPNGATRSPDTAWVSDKIWDTLTDKQQDKFPKISPEFVVELMSPSDKLKDAKLKMLEYIDNGVELAWLINPSEEEVHIYRQDGTISKVVGFDNILSGENVLPNFEFDLRLLR
ncbi:MAG: Uma2 family endonuclease [Arcicella sp.]|nr:Uma2 family endonuclease [Arcicella sp.]